MKTSVTMRDFPQLWKNLAEHTALENSLLLMIIINAPLNVFYKMKLK